jgi:multidrug efflux pump subunit AcrB
VLLSLVISLTVTPMLCSLFLTVRRMRQPCPPAWRGLLGPLPTLVTRGYWLIDRWLLEPVLLRPTDWIMARLSRSYAFLLRHALRHQWWVVPASLLLASTIALFVLGINIPLPSWAADVLGSPGLTLKPGLGKGSEAVQANANPVLEIKPVGQELVPSEDQNRFIVNIICPVGSSIDYVDEMLQKSEAALLGMQDPVTGRDIAATMFAAVSIRPGQLVSEGILFVRLIPADQRSWTQTDCMNELRGRLAKIPGMRTVVLDLSTQGFTPTRGYPIDFAVQGPDWDTVTRLSERIRERLIDSGVVTDVNSDYRPGMPEVRIRPDKVKAAELSVPISRLAYTINVAFGGVRNGRFTDLDKRYDVRLRYLGDERASPDQLEDVFIKSDKGKLVPLRDLCTRDTKSTLPVINRYNHLRKVEITANMAPGYAQGEAIRRSQEIAEQVRDEMDMPPSYRIVQLGNAQAMKQTLDSMWAALALGFVVAAMILGVQFNSFVHPFTVLIAVPFGVVGALAMLWVTGDTLNLMSMIGMVLLAGLVKKNSIILVDYTNQLRAQGMSLTDAVLTACPVRLRPIFMTSFATIASAVPLALGYGPGAETRAPLARSIIGGIFLSTLVTLIIVPIFYVLFDRLGAWLVSLTKHDEAKTERPAPRAVRPLPEADTNREANGAVAVPEPILQPALEVRPQPSG